MMDKTVVVQVTFPNANYFSTNVPFSSAVATGMAGLNVITISVVPLGFTSGREIGWTQCKGNTLPV
jgi:hypothetical protein